MNNQKLQKRYLPPRKAKKGRQDKGKILAPKRAKTAYLCYAEEARPKVKDANPDLKFGDTTKKVCEQWKALTKEEKVPYEEKAAQDKQRYLKEMEAYREKQDQSDDESDEGETGESEEEDGGENGREKATADKERETKNEQGKENYSSDPALKKENHASGPVSLRIGKGTITFDARGLSGNARLSLLTGCTTSPVLKTPQFYDNEPLEHPFPKVLWYKDSKVEWYDITLTRMEDSCVTFSARKTHKDCEPYGVMVLKGTAVPGVEYMVCIVANLGGENVAVWRPGMQPK